MDDALKQNFARAIIYLKKASVPFPLKPDMHMGELVIMSKIEESNKGKDKKVYVSEIQNNLHVSKPAVSQVLNSLEKKGYISRGIDADDRRKIEVSLTLKGQEIMNEMKGCLDKTIDEVIFRFGEDDTRQAVELFTRLAGIFEDIKHENLNR